jgi:hypothetical protein
VSVRVESVARRVIAAALTHGESFEGEHMLLNLRSASGAVRLAVVCVALSCVAVVVAGPAQSALNVSVLENAPDRVVIQYQFGDYQTVQVDVNGQPYTVIRIPHEACALVAGAPDLPHVARSVIVPPTGGLTVSVDPAASAYDDFPNVALAPSKGNLYRTQDPAKVPYVFDPGVYAADAFYPGPLAEVREPYTLRDFRGAVVDVHPFQYNPVTQTLRVYNTMTVTVRFDQAVASAARAVRPGQAISQAFDQIYQAHFINYSPVTTNYVPLNEQGSMLIICYDAWLANVQPLVTHKNGLGIPTTAVGVSTIPGGNTATAIKNYIQGVYNQGNLAFVLLVGDAAQIATPTASGGSADPTYAKVAGADDYPDILVGRFSSETAAQVDTQVQRTITYEDMPATLQTWYHKGTGIGSEYGAGQGDDGEADYVHIGNIRTQLLASGYTVVDQFYGINNPIPTPADVAAALNQGRGVMNYCGHGSQTSWDTTAFSSTNVAALQNDNMLPFVFSVACVNGQFDGATCFAEAWLRSTHNGQPIGAVAAYMSSINQSWAPPMQAQDEFNALLSAGTYHSIGALCFAGSCSMMDAYGSGGVDMFNTWIIFGDPSLRVIGLPPPPHGLAVTPGTGLAAQGQVGGPFTPSSADYTLQNMNSTPLDYQVTKTVNWLAIANASGTIPGNGSAIVTVSFNSSANMLGTGNYSDTVQFVNTTDHDGDGTRSVALKVGFPAKLYEWTLDTNPGWPTQGEWAFGHPTGQGGAPYGRPDPNNGHTGANVYGVNLSGNYSTTASGPWYTTAGPVDLHNATETSLKFWRWLNSDYQPYAYATVQVSTNGTNWTMLWQNGPTETKDAAWAQQTYDISAVANNQAAVWFRWGYQIANGAWAYSGWNIDDIEVWGLPASGPVSLHGDMNCDGAVTFADIDLFVEALAGESAWTHPACPWANADVNGDGLVTFADIDPFVAAIGTTAP